MGQYPLQVTLEAWDRWGKGRGLETKLKTKKKKTEARKSGKKRGRKETKGNKSFRSLGCRNQIQCERNGLLWVHRAKEPSRSGRRNWRGRNNAGATENTPEPSREVSESCGTETTKTCRGTTSAREQRTNS